nr:MAG TPA: hypothetical protein [Caudoviricetes sp.]
MIFLSHTIHFFVKICHTNIAISLGGYKNEI